MAEVLRAFDEPIRDGAESYHARVVGRHAPDGMWEGWFEFIKEDGTRSEPLTTPAESRQPEREHLVYWASGLTTVYAEGALRRARAPITVRTRIVDMPLSEAPAVKSANVTAHEPNSRPHPVLNPFEVGSRSLDVLAQELGALGRARLLNIVAAFDLNRGRQDLSGMTDPQLIRFIVTAVDARMMPRVK